ncbi:M23 family metallopeptidase [Bradyrhizobium sp.]|uniref:M23 family metallopeptidase n=1 Tax=Bradyrhizobium sp. TaxID=376 RepID=UPI001EC087A5|nr:peptidoglycan DD-metalloendopeptidase family protein [Bradyrhizobium sp.]MBV8918387.1 peptidoglycan DD-metalloendopeptidase family protein [Bradyrhizobium sp.]MBV9984640.1 peptidoglycan DD-metalloendopeptidase family protein [Bradyrhizobium sp.]
MSYNYPGFRLAHPFPEPRPKEKFGYHGGADYAAEAGTPVPAMFGGTVFRSGYINGYGMAVVIRTETAKGPIYTLYGHLGPNGLPKVTNEDGTHTVIQPGQPVGEVATRAFNETFNLHYNPHLHLEIISGKAILNPKANFGIISSDLTHRANPETFDINNPQFPYEIAGRPPKPGQAPANSPFVTPSRPPLPQGALRASPASPAPTQLSPGMPIPGAGGPSSIGGPDGPTPLVPPGGSQVPLGPQLRAPTVSPLNFAPEAPQKFSPLTLPRGPMPTPHAIGNNPTRDLSGRFVNPSATSPFDAGAPPVPFVVSSNPLALVRAASLDDRSRVPSPPIAPPDPDQGQSGDTAQGARKNIRVLTGRFAPSNRGGGAPGRSSPPLAPSPAAEQSGWPPAHADRRPVPEHPVPPPPSIYGLPDPSANNMDDWFNRWIKPLFDR